MWGHKYFFIFLSLFVFTANAQDPDFSQRVKWKIQIGDEYVKIPYEEALNENNNQHIRSLIYNSVLINPPISSKHHRGSGFYIGKHHGRHLFLTNAHVLSRKLCPRTKIKYLDKNLSVKTARCENVYFEYNHDKGSDLTLFSIRAHEIENIKGSGLSIDFNFSPKAGLPLATHGFGVKRSRHNNKRLLERYNPKLAADKDCVIISADNLTTTFFDSDNNGVRHNFATGCDISSGDSGSALINRNSGKVIGLIWAEAKEQPRGRNKISSAELWKDIIGSNDPRIWDSFSYAFSLTPFKKDFAAYLENH